MLTDSRIRQLKPNGKLQKLSDGGGLHIDVTPTGSMLWRLSYRFNGKQKILSIGPYPAVSLRDARRMREEAHEMLAKGIDPSAKKQEDKALAKMQPVTGKTFRDVAEEWFGTKKREFSEKHIQHLAGRFNNHLYPVIGDTPIAELRGAAILEAVKPLVEKGDIYSAHAVLQLAGRVCGYAQTLKYCDANVSYGLVKFLPKYAEKHRATVLKPDDVGLLFARIENAKGRVAMRYALRLLPYVYLRSAELRGGRWEEVDFERKVWTVPAERMKMKVQHIVPLARQVIELLTELRDHTGDKEFMFYSPSRKTNVISDVGLLHAVRKLGYNKETMTVHGFRSIASTFQNDMGFNPDVIEAQLAHKEQDRIRA
ncbi:MAG: integrase arm-type DNA-binding domain-containing protein, partial [Desulfovibrio sp.]|nr:integrase arm-type DNA-binding domain-containing protein [Desulfovibrio sp.]